MITLLLVTALLMEGIGSYISIMGLGSFFQGDLVIMAMILILDIAKITSVSFLYQYGSEFRRAWRYYLTIAVVVLMVISSAGAFGYLSGAFQRAIQPNAEITLKVEALTQQQATLEAEKRELTDQKASINKQIEAIPTKDERARRQLIASMKPELDRTSKRLETVSGQLDVLHDKTLEAKSGLIEKNVTVGPIVYISKAFGLSMEDASKYVILIIVSVFDPLAIMLILAANFLIKRKKAIKVQESERPKRKLSEVLDELPHRVVPETIPETIEASVPVATTVEHEMITEPVNVKESVLEEKFPEPTLVPETIPETIEPLPVKLHNQGVVL